MKTIKRIILAAVFTMTTFVNYANTNEINTIIDVKKVRIVFNDAKKGNQLFIKDNNGVVLHSEDITTEGKIIKFFNFSELKNGNYTLELEKDFEIIIKSIKVDGNTVIFEEDSKKTIFKPVIRNDNNKLMISKISFDKNPLQVSLYYNNEVIYSETFTEVDNIFNKVYKLDEQEKGNYKVVVYNNERSYINEFKI